MPRQKKGGWKPGEVKELLKIQRGPKSTEQLNELAAKWGRHPANLRAKWGYEKNKESDDDWDTPMVFKIDRTIRTPKRKDTSEIVRMRKGLDLVIPDMTVDGGSLPIPSRLAGPARKYLDEVHKKHKYVLSEQYKDGKKTGFTRIFRRR